MKRLALLAALACAVACGPRQPRDPRWIVVALGNSPTNLDPGVGLDDASQRVHQLIFSALMKLDHNLMVVPDLATRLDTNDWQTYTAEIPRGVRFHDGQEMTSADVAYTFERFLDPTFVSGRKGAFRALDSVDIVGPYTVAFHLRAPSGSFPINLAYIGIVPAASAGARIPIGSGPYRLIEFLPDDHVTLAAFDDYYGGAPKNAGIVIKVVPDGTMRGLELRKGDVDLVVNELAPDVAFGLEEVGQLRVERGLGTDYAYVGLNLRDPVLKDRRVRQAIGYAVDRPAIVRYLRRDQARETSGLIPSMSWAHVDGLFQFTYNPARARALLDEAGFRDPDGDGPQPRLHLTLKTSTAEDYRLQAAVLQRQLADVGIAVDVRSNDFATLFADVVRGNFQLYTLVFTGGSVADPDILRRVFHSSQFPPDGFNRGHYVNVEVDTALDRAAGALSQDDRRAAYALAQRLIAEDAPIISLWARTNIAVSQPALAGISLSPIGDFEFLKDVFRSQ